ncbi:hypothetical protein AVEN_36427-1 [Araneus ventricosus]|uniref:Uncharacterized protein n=1 Tax=Araneus ventricosus TaxID=182803 RepID=A0A4Y2U9A2_ARAVE|nr:hypothetical protein AVEN_36427-1 [Araneus ventricosus]
MLPELSSGTRIRNTCGGNTFPVSVRMIPEFHGISNEPGAFIKVRDDVKQACEKVHDSSIMSATRPIELSCRYVNMAGRIDASAKCELRSVIRFFQAGGCVHLHSAVVTQQLLEKYKWDVSDQPAYSLDLATSDFHLFPEMKNWLGGQSFQINDEIQRNVKAHLTILAAKFLKKRIGNLVHRYEKCLNIHGDFMEK